MGCDIHCYVEYYNKNESNPWVNSFSYGELDFGRDYVLFGCLAGVRSCIKPEISPRGIPNSPELSYASMQDYYIRVVTDEQYESSKNEDSFIYWSPNKKTISESALQKEYIDRGYKIKTETINNCKVFADPDFHNSSYLYLNELKKVRKNYLLEYAEFWSDLSKRKSKEILNFINSKCPSELMNYTFSELESRSFYSTICLMDSIERCSSDVETRLVFWFDN